MEQPLYEYRDTQPALKWMIVIVGIGMFAMAIFMPNDPTAPPALMWGLRFFLLFFSVLTIVVTPDVRLRAFADHLEIRYGLTKLISFNLDYGKITKIEAVTYNPLKDFGGWGIKSGGGKWKGWMAYTASISNKALAIETTEKKYLLGCNNPEEAETMLRNAAGIK
ncbi:MAG: hypothetical protein NTY09_03415 [bacterium]|nr:hypothetical protein [bacterium]